MIEITEEILEAAMKKAVEVGVFPEEASITTYLHNWNILEEIVRVVIEKLEDD